MELSDSFNDFMPIVVVAVVVVVVVMCHVVVVAGVFDLSFWFGPSVIVIVCKRGHDDDVVV